MNDLINKIICDDCIEFLSKHKERFADLIFADPPFNIGYKYDKYHDKHKRENYIEWTRKWITACKNVLKPTGSFYIAIGDTYAANIKIIADELGLSMRNWIIWYYTFGQQTKTKFARAHTHIFYFVNNPKEFTFNDHAVRVPSQRQLTYNDRRANSTGKIPDDVWNTFPRVCGTFKERAGWHPCQMPETLLKRIIAVSSNPGDLVLDPFSGSGTTPAAAYQFGRKYLALEISETYVENARQRLAELGKQCPKQNLLFKKTEFDELKRLLSDTGKTPKQVTTDPSLLAIVTSQLAVRMNNAKKYQVAEVAAALRDFAG